MDAFLSIKGLSFSYHSPEGETKALHDINLSLKEGEFIAIVGPSGCGKSTLLSLIAGLLPFIGGEITAGEILLQNRPVSENRDRIGYMLQKDHLFPWRSTKRNVLLGPEIRHDKTSEKETKALALLDSYGLAQFAGSSPSSLSGGMRQRAALIRTLMTEPALLLLDEPFSALDYQTRLNVSDDICKQIRKEQITAILVTHDISEAISVADRVVILSKRPATVAKTLDIQLDMDSPLRSPLLARSSPNFTHYFNLVWKELTT